MNRLQKKAWKELALVVICVVAAGIGLAVLVHLNAKGVAHVIICTVVGLGVALVSCLRNIKFQTALDEREKMIAQKAFMFAVYAFVAVIGCLSFILFFLIGGGGRVPVYVLPMLLLAGLFVAQFVESAVVLVQFAREQADE